MNLILYQFEIPIRKTKENDVINHVTLIWAFVWILLIMLTLYLSAIWAIHNKFAMLHILRYSYLHVLHNGSYPYKLGSTITSLSITVRLIRARFVRLTNLGSTKTILATLWSVSKTLFEDRSHTRADLRERAKPSSGWTSEARGHSLPEAI